MELSGLSEEEILRKIEKTLREMLEKMRLGDGKIRRGKRVNHEPSGIGPK